MVSKAAIVILCGGLYYGVMTIPAAFYHRFAMSEHQCADAISDSINHINDPGSQKTLDAECAYYFANVKVAEGALGLR